MKVENACNISPHTCSRDTEVFVQYDKTKRVSEVKLRFWGEGSRSIRMMLRLASPSGNTTAASQVDQQQQREQTEVIVSVPCALYCPCLFANSCLAADDRLVCIRYSRGDDVQTGRDNHTERKEMLQINMMSTSQSIVHDKALLVRWCVECLQAAVTPPADVVEVYGLQQASKEWTPEWQLERTRLLKNGHSVGERFYLERAASKEILIDASLWSITSLRIYVVVGPPGVGKSEFIVWLAGQLRLPLYRLSLHSPKLTDDVLAQVLAHNWLKHDAALVQLDEFQSALARWTACNQNYDVRHEGITAGGLCEVLQGATTLSRGVIILSGTEELSSHTYREHFRALYRRFNRSIVFKCLEETDICTYSSAPRTPPDRAGVPWGDVYADDVHLHIILPT